MENLKEFSFYLDAWKYCREHGIVLSCIVKKNFRIWNVIGVSE